MKFLTKVTVAAFVAYGAIEVLKKTGAMEKIVANTVRLADGALTKANVVLSQPDPLAYAKDQVDSFLSKLVGADEDGATKEKVNNDW